MLGALFFYPVYLLLMNVFGIGVGIEKEEEIHISN
jgi:hypothetical protein